MKMTDRKARRIILSLLLCGCFASTAHAAETTLYESSDGRVTVTADTAEKTVTYKGADGTETTYSYTTIDTGSINIAVTGLEYASPNDGTTEKKYYAWTEDGFKEVEAAQDAQVTVSYVTYNPYGDGILNDSDSTTYAGGISGDFVNDSMHGGSSSYGGAIDNYAGSENAYLGTITGNFIGNNEIITGTSEGSGPHQHAHGGAIANYGADDYTASIYAITGNFIGNYAQSTGYFESSTESYGEVAHGGAIYNAGTIGDITGNFIGNYAQSQVSQAYGGAIYNNSSIGNITGNFIGNWTNAEEGGFAWGGAIINQSSSASITGISGYFLGNYVKTGGSYAWGGAIENNGGAIGSIEGTFIGNFAEHSGQTTGSAYGGAISTSGTVTTIEGDFIGNHALATERYAQAGAIGTSARITTLTGNFIGNYAASTGSTSGYSYAMGGALYNSGTIGTLNASFTGNYATSANSYVWGGALYNSGTITTLTGDFTDNYASTTGSNVRGGAIYNRGTIESLNAKFTGNYASTTGNSYIYGGAINNTGTITAIEGSFTGNYAQSLNTGVSTRVLGGAIYNESGTIGTITADFTGNHARTLGTFAYGGAIYNEDGTIGTINGNFTGNYALSEGSRDNSYAYGGAIYNTGTITGITGTFAGNYAESAANDSYGGAIFNQGTIGDTDNPGADGTGIYKATFTGNTAARGGAIYNGTEKDGDAADPSAGGYSSIITSISGSSFTGNSASGYGGAIYNYDDGAIYSITDSLFQENFAEGGNGGAIENAEANSYIGTISGNTFEGNYTKASGYGGGAIYNEGTIDSITGNVFKGNEAVSYGGAIYNNGGTIVSMDGGSDGGFEENSAQYGGAIYNTGTIGDIASDFTSNTATSTSGSAYGGAIYNTGTIGVITGDFDTNSVESSSGSAYGGAIYNTGTIAGIKASKNGFTGNYATSGTTTSAHGGAIYNYASEGSSALIGATVTTDPDVWAIESDFSGNTAGEGGAIYNYATGESSIAAIGDIKGSFTSNEADDSTGNSQGGAINNTAAASGYAFIGSITGDFTGNKSVDSSNGTVGTETPTATGGAIYNTASGSGGAVAIGDITGSFYYNSAEATGIGNARGGAVNNAAGAAETTATIGKITGDFTGNYSKSASAAAWGGAILNIADSPDAVAEIGDITGTDDEGNPAKALFSDNYAESAGGNVLGGAIHNRAGTNSSDTSGKTTVIIGNITADFTGNYVTNGSGGADGGAISNLLAGENTNEGRMAVIGTITGDFSGNTATATSAARGGAISNRGNGGYGTAVIGGTVTEGSITMNDYGIIGNFTGNTATGATAYGGAIANYAQGYVTAQIGDITGDFKENEATATGEALGGAIYNNAANSNNGTATIGAITGDFTGNYATSTSSGSAEGGAIYNAGTITGLTGAFDGNYVTATSGTAQGGAIYNTGSIGGTDGYTVTSLTGNTASGTAAYGGGIYDTASSTVTVEGAVTGNYAAATAGSAMGGAVYNTTGTLNITGTAIGGSNEGEGNYVSATGDAYGGAIYNVGTLNITNEDGVTVSGNSATSTGGNAAGGAIYNTGTITGLTGAFSGNSATSTGGYAVGGAIFNTGTATGGYTVTGLSGNNAEGATAAYGGGIYDESGSTIYVTGGVTDNHATATSYAQGGAIYNTGTLTIASGVTVSGNSASSSTLNADGGAIFNADGGTITDLNNVTFTLNTAGAGGAVANAHGGTIVSITGSTFTGNTASDSGSSAIGYGGGAIFNYGGTIGDITGSTFTSNSASSRGGAIYNEDTSTMGSVLGSVFESNKAYDGGAIYNGDTMGSVAGSTFTGNTAENSGGAIYNEVTMGGIGSDASGTVTSFTSNTAEGGSGGAIYNGSYGKITNGITGSTFTGNAAENGIDAAYGGAIYNEGTIGGLVGVSFSGNSATSGEGDVKGGALYNSASGSIGSVTISSLTGNYAATSMGSGAYGGGIYDEAGSTITVAGAITGNYASATSGEAKGGAIYNTTGTLNITGSAIGGGTYDETTGKYSGSNYVSASGDAMGGAIYNEGTLNIAEGTALTGNTATSTGGVAYGGAIYNTGTIGGDGLVLGDVTGNSATGYSEAKGGAIYDTYSTSITIGGDALNNHVSVTADSGSGNDVAGGVLYLEKSTTDATYITVTGNVAGNSAETASGSAMGGAFYNNASGTLTIGGDIGGYDASGNTNGNYVKASGEAAGGAIYNEGILNIGDSPDLIGNYAVSTEGEAKGGAIYNKGTITGNGVLNLGDITGNYVEGATGAYGGAIYDTVTTVVNISGNVTDNHAEVTESGNVQGGVIYLEQAESNPTSITVTGDVAGNWAKTNEGTAEGGAFYNGSAGSLSIAGTIGGYTDETKTEYNGNSVSATADAAGGAIYNAGTLTISEAPDLIGNYATSTAGAAYGGAIYNEGTIYNTGTVTEGIISLGNVIGNTATGYSGAQGGAVYDTAYTGVSISGEVTDNHAIVTREGNVEGGVIYLAKADEGETTITVTGNVTGNSAETASGYAHGGAFYNNNVGTLTIGGSLGGTYDEDTKTYSGGNYVTATGEAYGGAIYNAGTLTVGSDGNPIEVTGNYATSSQGEAAGGAIYNTGTATVTGGSMEGNKASATGETGDAMGGAIYNAEGATLNITAGVALSGNAVTSNAGKAMGGAIYNIGEMSENGAVQGTLYFGDITGNSATGATGAYGGAIYDTINTDIVIEGNVTDNYAKVTGEGNVRGGVIYLEQAESNPTSITVQAGSTGEGGNVAGNHAETEGGYAWGGAFYNNANGTLSISGTIGAEDDGNYVSASGEAKGGAVYNTGILIINEAGPDLIGNYAVSSAGDAAGGAIYNAGTFANAGSTGGVLNLGNITGNYAEGATSAKGGAIYDTVTTTINISGDVTGNHVKVTSAAGTPAEGSVYGGVIYLEKANAGETTITVSGNVAGNYAETENGVALGGAFYNNGDGTLNISGYIGSYTDETTGTEYEGNHASASGDAAGGAIYNAGNLNISTTNEIKGNYAVSTGGTAAGGAIYNSGVVNGGGTLVLGALTGNYAVGSTGAYGGAIYDTVSTEVQINGDVTDNHAITESGSVHGGVIYLGQAAGGAATSITVTGNVTENYAKTADGEALGGAFYNNANGTLTISAADGDTLTVSGNYVSAAGEGNAAKGGAIYNEGILNITNGVVLSGNTATSSGGEAAGGAIYTTGTVNNGAALYFGGITGNSAIGATGAKGGAIYDAVSTVININGAVSDNHAIVNGAGVTDANVYGGVIYLEQAENQATSITVTGTVTGNSAETSGGKAYGGAFYNNGEATLTIVKDGTSVVTGNYVKATGGAAGGAIYNAGTLNLGTDPVLTGNYAMSTAGTAMGGAIYNEGTINTLETSSEDGLVLGELSGNQAVGATGAMGGAIYDTVNTVITINGDVTDNHARVVSKDETLGYEAATAVSGDVMGGVIYLEQADSGAATTITVKGNVAGNSAETENGNAYGGAFYNTDNGTLTITGNIGGYTDSTETEYNGNYVVASGEAKGGAIYNTGTLNISDGDGSGPDLIGNYAESTGGVAMGGAIYNEGTISEDGSLTFGAVTGNQAIGATGAYGGAIYDTVSTVVNINGNVTDNHAIVQSDDGTAAGNVYGGVIYLAKADSGAETAITVTGTVTRNSAETENGSAYGGAFYNNQTATLTIIDADNNSIISGNYVSAAGTGAETSGTGNAYGGAIYNAGTLNLGSEVVLTGNSATSEDGAAYGGAIYNIGTINTTSSSSADGELVLGALTGNSATGATGAYGGAIYDTVDAVITINGSVSDNHAIVTEKGDVYGGVIYLEKAETGEATTITVNGDVTGNSAETKTGNAYGGAFYNHEAGTLTITGSIGGSEEGDGNKVVATGEAFGGAIYNEGTLNIGGTEADDGSMTYTDIIGNTAESTAGEAAGGAIYNAGTIESGSDTSELVFGNIKGNSAIGATGAKGGAIYDEYSTDITINGEVSDNHAIVNGENAENANVYGGVIYLGQAETGAETTITVKGSVKGNSAETTGGEAMGGAFYNYEAGTLTITGTIGGSEEGEGNYVIATGNAYGGAIYNEGLLNITGVETDGETTTYTDLIGNTATSTAGVAAGGAIYNTGTIASGETETLEVGNVKGNSATGYTGAMGGAIYDEVYTSITINGEASDNHVKVTGTDLTGKADVKGGVIYLEKAEQGEATEITVTGNVSGNSAETIYGSAMGGAFYNNEQATLTIGGEISGNEVSATDEAYGGAIYNEGVLNIVGTEADDGSMTYTNITGNKATSSAGVAAGGAIYNAGTIETGSDVTETLEVGNVTGNTAEGYTGAMGGAIYDTEYTSVTIHGYASDNHVKVTGTDLTEKADVKGGVIYLAKADQGEATEITVTGNVSDNSAETTYGSAYGGAFYNDEQATLTIGGDISGNYVIAAGEGNVAYGGAIYNDGLLNINSDEESGPALTGNYAVSEDGEAAGGAIYNTGSVNGDGEVLHLGAVTNNYVQGATAAEGGAIYDAVSTEVNIYGDVTGNYAAVTKEGDVKGGVIYLERATSEETAINITGSVTGNHAETASGTAEGGAFYNHEMSTLTIGGDISGNWASSEAGGDALGGAIYNEGTLNVADGITLSGNYAASSAGEAAGGAIYNTGSVNGDETMNLTSVTGNYAEGATAAYGGAIYDAGTGADIAVTGDVTGNTATASDGEAAGGAIYIGSGSSITIEGDVTGNSATGTAAAKGGAIYNEGTVTLNGTVTGNTASGDDAQGGAIYNAGTVTMNIENQDAEITGNYVEKGGNKEANIVYGEAGSTTNINIKDGSVTLLDSFEGDAGYGVNIAGSGIDAATFYLYDNLLKDSSLSMAGITFNTINNSVTAYSVDKFTVAGDFDMVADVDLENESMDRIVTNGNSYGEHAGNLNVAGVNLISDTDKSRVGIYFAEPGLKENVTSSIGALPGSYQQTAYSPINEYSVTYDKNYDGSWGDDGGYFVFNRERSNPSAMIPPLSQVGAFNAMSLMFDYAFEHSDYYMKLPSEVRLAIREKAKAARAEKLAEKNGTTFEEESAKIDEAREEEMASREGVKFYEHDNVLPLYDQNELTRPGAWVKPFSSIESVPFKGDFKARDKYYGVLLGADTDVREGRDGWASVFTGYAGYQGIHQSYEGGVIRQDGGVLGVTESFYKKNFYTAWTAAAASTRADGRTMYGHDKTRLYTYGIASKSGWNLEYDGGKYIVLPTFMASYTYVDLRSYTSAAGLKMDADGMRAVQLNPNIKWIRNMRNGWQPYLTVGEVWTVGQRSSARADGHRLDTLRLRPYTEYGLGAQKRWANEYDGYFQVLGHAGGRRGALFTMGFRWTFN